MRLKEYRSLGKTIWIFNHYATMTYRDRGGRHFYIAENLIKLGHKPIIFCASTVHNSDMAIHTGKENYKLDELQGIPYVFIKTPSYIGNGIQRIRNMVAFYRRIFSVTTKYLKTHQKPDVIIASSVHPLTLIAGLKIAKKLNVPCICEIRDLWPESLVAYKMLKKSSVITKLLYHAEKLIYKKADKLIFTMEGGKDYIIQKGWSTKSGGPINLNKVYHINNGIDLEAFNYRKDHFVLDDPDLNDASKFKVIYTGSIRKVNNLKKVVEIAESIHRKGVENIKFLIYGDGPEKKELEKYCLEQKLPNIQFKGFVEKKFIPYVLSQSNLNIMNVNNNDIKVYGDSLNKMFDYFASGKPIITSESGYDLVKKYNCGLALDEATKGQFVEGILKFSRMPQEEYQVYCRNALLASKDYDFNLLTKKLESLF